MPARLPLIACLLIAATAAATSASSASAQELTGTYIRYVGTGVNGVLINSLSHSMQYTESGFTPYSCDVFSPGSPVEEFSFAATGTTSLSASNSAGGTGAFTTIASTTVSGRTITWSGRYTNGSHVVTISQVMTFNATDRYARLAVTLTNSGSIALSNVYYMRNGDPDHGSCTIGTAYETNNDVLRQPPTNTSALVVATATSTPTVTIGIGSHDSRARASVASSINNVDPITTWTSPFDAAGAAGDVGISLAFRATSLAIGASTTFEILYVWGPDATTVASRFDALGPAGCSPEGGACAVGTISGICRSGRCCTGCWDGVSCQAGNTTGQCGTRGGLCLSCDDSNQCTTDSCSLGACSNPRAPAGTGCNDGQFCTMGDACNTSGVCTGAPLACNDGLSCTTDMCNESSDSCGATVSTGCLIASSCIAADASNPSNPCQACIPSLSTTSWSARPSGTVCGTASCAGGALSPAPTCIGGACTPGAAMTCMSGRCAGSTACDDSCSSDAECPEGQHCNASSRCEADLGNGAGCSRPSECTSGSCADGVCCSDACDGTCEACNVPGIGGTCSPHASGTDPDGECAPGTCNGAGTCTEGPPDGGITTRDGGPAGDGGPGGDSGMTFPTGRRRAGCACAVPGAGGRDTGAGALAGGALFALVGARRIRRRLARRSAR